MLRGWIWAVGLTVGFALVAMNGQAQDKKDKKDEKKIEKKVPPKPAVPATLEKVAYGKHERQVLDFYKAKSDKPTPVVFYIHGGGWRGGDKNSVGNVKAYLDVGISVVAINYRYTSNGEAEKVEPPVKAPLHDAARALQFVRSKASEWNIDKIRIGATGGSAGGCSSLWLAFHDDMANPKSDDPIARESTRLYCAAVNGAQTSLDPKELKEWMPNYTYGAHAFGMKDLAAVEENRAKLTAWLKEYSPIEHVSKDDPPIGLYYKGVKGAKKGENHPDPTHSPMLGLLLVERLKKVGVESVMVSTDIANDTYPTAQAYLIAKLRK